MCQECDDVVLGSEVLGGDLECGACIEVAVLFVEEVLHDVDGTESRGLVKTVPYVPKDLRQQFDASIAIGL